MAKIVIAPDSFKGTLTAAQVAAVIASEFRKKLPDKDIIELPIADGGEGTVDAMQKSMGGEIIGVEVCGPMGDKTLAHYLFNEEKSTAVIEMASASGIELVEFSSLNPMMATTYGTGELIKDAISRGAKEIILGIGGSATVDGGLGMAEALGFKLLDKNGKKLLRGGVALSQLSRIVYPDDYDIINSVNILVACDVKNPLTGENGAAYVFGPQKNATKEMIKKLDSGLKNLYSILKKESMLDKAMPGDGAAGGMGIAVRAFLCAKLSSGADIVLDAVEFDDIVRSSYLVVTGEGKSDAQTFSGKLCYTVCKRAETFGVKTVLISGGIEERTKLSELFYAVFSTSSGEANLNKMLKSAEYNLRETAKSIASLIKLNF